MAKYTLRLPTDQYAYIEIEAEGTPEDAVQAFTELQSAYNSNIEGLNIQQWAKTRDTYVKTGEISQEDYEALSKAQKFVINEIKKSLKRN